ncbi:nucleotidyltransferase family protein [Bacillaceae bacterium SIJ1]|uniref:nucleotidyltransferase family protein n=1 Tax=Litoribacterium kuwaitense TaxID=1398745 RepID=UPI0013EC0764|nr:nucleotidyltransferase family protein [Litoribacterium kuwaitense]NGP44650.1 nucleotidyltransferase family protein [Litoribacterium kuwaitense]
MPAYNKGSILQKIKEDRWLLDILHSVQSLNLPDWWVCAGVVRSSIWDTMYDMPERTPVDDIDVIYFDRNNTGESIEKMLEHRLRHIHPGVPWSVKNQARMHLKNELPPYTSSTDAMAKFPETVTAVGLTLDEQQEVLLNAPHGIDDLLQGVVRPTPLFRERADLTPAYKTRVLRKNWRQTWPQLTIVLPDE